ncbi:MAG: hypothetical protein LUH36_07790, partial [Oscillospiraceae bacterium]|nr:hypothetical protein [Oscillospiraceae bacterium]
RFIKDPPALNYESIIANFRENVNRGNMGKRTINPAVFPGKFKESAQKAGGGPKLTAPDYVGQKPQPSTYKGKLYSMDILSL